MIFVSTTVLPLCLCTGKRNWNLLFLLNQDKKISLSNDVSLILNSKTNYTNLFLSAKTLFTDNILPEVFVIIFKLKFLNNIKSPGTLISFTDPDNVKRLSLTIKTSTGNVDKVTLSIIFHPFNEEKTIKEFLLPFTKYNIWSFALSIKHDKIILYTSCDDTRRPFGFESITIKPPIQRNFFKDGAILNLFHEINGKNKLRGEIFELGFTNYAEKIKVLCSRPMIEGSGNKETRMDNTKIGNVIMNPEKEDDDSSDDLNEALLNEMNSTIEKENRNSTVLPSIYNSTANSLFPNNKNRRKTHPDKNDTKIRLLNETLSENNKSVQATKDIVENIIKKSKTNTTYLYTADKDNKDIMNYTNKSEENKIEQNINSKQNLSLSTNYFQVKNIKVEVASKVKTNDTRNNKISLQTESSNYLSTTNETPVTILSSTHFRKKKVTRMSKVDISSTSLLYNNKKSTDATYITKIPSKKTTIKPCDTSYITNKISTTTSFEPPTSSESVTIDFKTNSNNPTTANTETIITNTETKYETKNPIIEKNEKMFPSKISTLEDINPSTKSYKEIFTRTETVNKDIKTTSSMPIFIKEEKSITNSKENIASKSSTFQNIESINQNKESTSSSKTKTSRIIQIRKKLVTESYNNISPKSSSHMLMPTDILNIITSKYKKEKIHSTTNLSDKNAVEISDKNTFTKQMLTSFINKTKLFITKENIIKVFNEDSLYQIKNVNISQSINGNKTLLLNETSTKSELSVNQTFENNELKRCLINLEKLINLDTCKNAKQLRLLTRKPGNKGEKGIKGERGEKGNVGPQGNSGTCTKQLCKAEYSLKGLKGDKGNIGLCEADRCIIKNGDKGDKGSRGLIGPKGNKGEMNDIDLELIKVIVSSILPSEIESTKINLKGIKGEAGVCKCNIESKSTVVNKPKDPFQENINIGYGSLVFENRQSLEKVSFHLPLGSMAFLLTSDTFLVKVDHLNNIWRSITLESRSKDWILPGIQTTPKMEPQIPIYANSFDKKLHLVALSVSTMGDLKSTTYQPGGYAGASFQCQQNGDIYGYGTSMHPLINTDMFNMRFIIHDIYKYLPIYNSRGEILAKDFITLLSSKDELLNEILDFDRKAISENILSPCAWIGKDPIPEYRDYQENFEFKCNNWMTRHPLKKGLVSLLLPLKPILADDNVKKRACSLQCHVLCIQTEPHLQ